MTRSAVAGIKEQFCASLEWMHVIEWFDRTGVFKMPRGRRATITLESHGMHDEYPGFLVRIVSKNEGEVVVKYFKFDDYLEDRVDTRTDYPLGGNICFQVIASCGWKWYIAEPKSTKPFCEAVERWIRTWL